LTSARGRCAALTWSPEGASLAFVNDRGDHAFIGVYGLAGKSLRFMDPIVDTGLSPLWSPDPRQIAFVRIAASHGLRAGLQRSAPEPWSIRRAELTNNA